MNTISSAAMTTTIVAIVTVAAEQAAPRERASETYGERGERERRTDAERGSVAARDEALRRTPTRPPNPAANAVHAIALRSQPSTSDHDAPRRTADQSAIVAA